MVRSLVSLVLLLLLVMLVVVFAWQNPGLVEVDLAFGKFEFSKALAFATTLAIGWLWGVLSVTVYVIKLLRERRQLKKKVRLADAELNNLRSLPMHDGG